MRRAATLVVLLAIASAPAAMAESEVVYRDDFDSHALRTKVAGWDETPLSDQRTRRRAVSPPDAFDGYRVRTDPRDERNRVFGIESAIGLVQTDPRGTGLAATYRSIAGVRSTFTGRFYRETGKTAIGIFVLAALPDSRRYYLLATSPETERMTLFAAGTSIGGTVVGAFQPAAGEWTRFRIETDDVAGATSIRARFWRDGSPEPSADAITAFDGSPSRLLLGRIGVWSAGGGAALFDDISLETTTAPTVDGPSLAVMSPGRGEVLAAARVDVSGRVLGATSVRVNGSAAIVDPEAKTFIARAVHLAEGPAAIAVVATDEEGRTASETVSVVVDTRAPDLTIGSPLEGSCTAGDAAVVRGRVFDREVAHVRVTAGNDTFDAVATAGVWSATVALPAEGSVAIAVEAADTAGHRSVATTEVNVDRTPPILNILESGKPLIAASLNRPVSFLAAADDTSPHTVAATLDGEVYALGTQIAEEGAHELRIIASDCAGNRSERVASFVIDRTPPEILSIAPEHRSTSGVTPEVRGTASGDAVRIDVEPHRQSFPVVEGRFALAGLAFEEGRNAYEFVVFDAAGNESRREYELTLRLSPPFVEILENGSPIATDLAYNRPLTPEIRSSDPEATITASLDGAPFAGGSTVATDGAHVLTAYATDKVGHRSETVSVSFTIDRTPPSIIITSPSAGGDVSGDVLEVRGNVSSDAVSVTVNGYPATIQATAFTSNVPIDLGTTLIVATATDAAGNSASAHVEVTRESAPTLIITSPEDGLITNRRSIAVAGQVFGAGITSVRVNGEVVPVEITGLFRKLEFPLGDGENTITVAVTDARGHFNSVALRVTADRTPPHVRLLESGQPLQSGARFPTTAIISTSVDGGVAHLFIDGSPSSEPVTLTDAGAHVAIATARDAAGNESRVERSFFIGAATSGCSLTAFDPPHGTVVNTSAVTLTGRTGSAAAVIVNGVPATVSNGSFCATVELPREGENVVSVSCAGGDGKPAGTATLLALRRVTGAPSIEITTPREGAALTTETITVSGLVSGDISSVEVNGTSANVTSGTFSAAGVRLNDGWNVIVARARNGGGGVATASRRVLLLKNTPAISITSPLPGSITGSSSIDVSGTWQHLDPSTITGADVTRWSDTAGAFLIRGIPLMSAENEVVVHAADLAGRSVAASVVVRKQANAPSVAIFAPADNSFVSHGAGESIAIEGTFVGAPGSLIEINGVPATISGNGFTATIRVIDGQALPVIARLTQPDGSLAVDNIRVHRTSSAPTIEQVFPPPYENRVDAGVLPMVLFSAAMDRASIVGALSLQSSNGTAVAGTVRVDREVATFTPAALLASGERYTLRVSTGATDLSGRPLAGEFSSSFTVTPDSATAIPMLRPLPTRVCAATLSIAGTAAANSRLRIDAGSLRFHTTVTAAGTFSHALPVGGLSGFLAVRVRTIGDDGSESPPAEACVLVDCGGPRVESANYDRSRNLVLVRFSKSLAPHSVTNSAVALRLADGRPVASGVAVDGVVVTVTPAEDLTRRSFTLTIDSTVEDTDGHRLAAPYVTAFSFESDDPPQAGNGSGFVTGEVFDGSTGWPLAGATVSVDTVSVSTDGAGRYAAPLPEGVHTLRISAPHHVTAWRQVVVRAGAAVVPVDVRLAVHDVSGITALDAQTLPGLLPLGWSPVGAAHVGESAAPRELTFTVPLSAIVAATQTLSAVRYEEDRDEWRVIVPVVNVSSDGRVTVQITSPGTYALVYGDRAPHLVRPPPSVAGATLQGVVDPCTSTTCAALVASSFVLDPPLILPTGRSKATLTVDGLSPRAFPSGTIVQAFIEEELRFADGSRFSAAPFATDLILYRTLDGNGATAIFEITPSETATSGVLETGFSNVRIQPYPGSVARGSLIGPEGGQVPGDGIAAIDIPGGATQEPIRATTAARPTSNLGTVTGFDIVSAFELTLQRTSGVEAVELLIPARLTLAASQSSPAAQHLLAEIIDGTPFGRLFRLVAIMELREGNQVTSVPVDRSALPLDGVVRAGRYVLLAAQSPVAFAYGVVRLPSDGPLVRAAHVRSSLGVSDLTGASGLFALPVPASPATPFTLIPRTFTSGDGTPYLHATSPEAAAVVGVGEIELTIQPPQVASTTPANGAMGVSLTQFIKATFTSAIDTAALRPDSIVVSDAAMRPVAGNVTAEGTTAILWTLPPGARLNSNTTYTVTISPAIRGTNGAALGQPVSFSFSTIEVMSSDSIRRDRIRITIPDAHGRSRVVGVAGALPSGWSAVPVRRAIDFAGRYQATASPDGSFTVAIHEAVALTDRIDLQVINDAGAVAAIIPLTPFVTDDGRGFIARSGENARFVTPEGAAIAVPAGAFDQPIVITTAPSVAEDVANVPQLSSELKRLAGIRLSFDGKASKRIDLEVPIPPDLDTTERQFVLGWLGESVRGPRIMIVDTLRVENGRFTTTPPLEALLRSEANDGLTPGGLKEQLPGIRQDGTFTIFSFEIPPDPAGPAWAVLSALSGNFDVFWDAYQSLYVSSEFIADQRRAVIPVPRGKQFEVVGVDASTGLEGFSRVYDPLPADDPAAGYVLPSPNPDAEGPYPVFGGPFRVEVAPVEVSGIDLATVRHFLIRQSNGMITARDAPSDPLPADIEVSMLNVSRGEYDPSRANGLSVAGEPGDRVVMLIEQRDVDPHSTISVVFSEPVWAGPLQTTPANIDAYLHAIAKIERLDARAAASPRWEDITLRAFFRLDSGNRRLLVDLPALQRGARYRLSLLPQLVDASDPTGGGDGLRIGQTMVDGSETPGIREPLRLHFQVRAPGGKLGAFDIGSGSIRDLALNGNLLLVAALDGGLFAYDTSDPAGLSNESTPVGVVSSESTQYWAIASDHHGRVFATGMTAITGALQSFALEQFLDRTKPAPRRVEAKSSMLVSWAPGAASSIGGALSDSLASGRPEGIPRKLQILLQDDDRVFDTSAAFISAMGASAQTIEDGFDLIRASIPRQDAHPYLIQRITVENMSLDMRWSADATTTPAVFDEVIARPTDRIRVIFNARTYAVVAIFGYGIGVYDLNAVESNDHEPKPPGYEKPREQIRITRGALRADGEAVSNPCSQPSVHSHAIRDLSFVPEATIITRPGSSLLEVYALDANRGVLDLVFVPPDETNFPHCERSPNGLVFRGSFESAPGKIEIHDHPRLVELRRHFETAARRPPFARFNSVSHYRWRLEAADNTAVAAPGGRAPAQGQRGSAAGTTVERDYLLLAGNEYGLLVADAGGTPPMFYPSYRWLEDYHFADLIWVPTGVVAVRAIPRTSLAVAIDGKGHALLIDLSRLDERWSVSGDLLSSDRLFPSAQNAVTGPTTWGGIGAPDPRVVWRSETPVAYGALAPLIDPDTGIVFAGNLARKELSVLSAIDPRMQLKVDLGAPSGLSEVGGIVPLGVEPPKTIGDRIASADPSRQANASLGAFRIEVTIPGGLPDQLTTSNRRVQVAIESERVPGAVVEQLPAPYPRTHLRTKRRDGTTDSRPVAFALERVLPRSIPAARLRHQRGFNKYASPWIVAVADPRASAAWEWPARTTAAEKAATGCASCDRPVHLRGKTEADGVYELYSAGRFITIRPDFCTNSCASNVFTGTPYAFLGARDRMVTRFPTVMADVVRHTSALVAAQNAPAAGGALQATTYLHSGEVEARAVDLDAGGRAGWNITFDRTYRSQSIGDSAIGSGWDSLMFRRLRPLPNGDVEYRDGAGEIWLFQARRDGDFAPTRGLYLSLRRTPQGWRIVDSKSRVTDFDTFGRITTESDEFADDPARSSRGNIIRYLYGADGRLAQVIDPVGRAASLAYFGDNEPALRAGRLREIRDWRDRSVVFDYDEDGRLTDVALPDVPNSSGGRPTIHYSYLSSGADLTSRLELGANLVAITDPGQPKPRLSFDYGSAAARDRVVTQRWTATGESATFSYPSADSAIVVDALGQRRTYTLTPQPTDHFHDRAHISAVEEHDVLTSTSPVGAIPASRNPNAPPRAPASRKFSFAHDTDGLVVMSRLEGVHRTLYTYASVPNAPGRMLTAIRTEPEGTTPGEAVEKKIAYQPGNAFVQSLEAGGLKIDAPQPHRANDDTTAANDEIETRTIRDEAGLIQSIVSTGGIDAMSAHGSATEYRYFSDRGPLHLRGLLREVVRPGLTPIRHEYPDADRVVTVDERNVRTEVKLDSWRRPAQVTAVGEEMTFDESSEYDASGRLHRHRRRQGALTVTTEYDYDAIGRLLSMTSDNVAIGGSLSQSEETTSYDLAARKITRTLATGAVVEELIDTLGRVTTRTTTTGTPLPIVEQFAYDVAGNLVWQANNHVVAARAFDCHGNAVERVDGVGVRTRTEYDAWQRPVKAETFSSTGDLIASSDLALSASGRVKESSTLVDDGTRRVTRAIWDGAGRQTGTDVMGRVTRSKFDAAGRLTSSLFGGGTLISPQPMVATEVSSHDGVLVSGANVIERSGIPIAAHHTHDIAGNVIGQSVGTLNWQQRFDQSGNVVSASLPSRPAASFEYDARGAMTLETQAGGSSTIAHQYDASGAAKQYRDQSSEITEMINDRIGRPRTRTYADGTSETFEYDGPRLLSMKDRQGRVFNYIYDDKGQVLEIRAGGGPLLDKFEYDGAGRMTKWTTADAALSWENFDFEGRPRKTTQTRLDAAGTPIDTYMQEHRWSVHGERSSWTMPSYAGFASSAPWTATVFEARDDAGNVIAVDRVIASAQTELLRAHYRNAGRPDDRHVTAYGSHVPIVRRYGYDANGQMSSMSVSSRGLNVAGSAVSFDGLQISRAVLLGVSGAARGNEYEYDARGRLVSSSFGREAGKAARAAEHLTPADFRLAHERTSSGPGEPPSLTFSESPGHKIDKFTRDDDQFAFAYGGAERVDDGRFVYEYDFRGRLIRATEKVSGGTVARRISYFYAGSNRVVGRRAEYGPPGGPWKLEDRADVIDADGVPPDITYAWDPVSDRVAAIFKTGSSANASVDANGGLVRQFIHGGLDYDDPIEVTVADPNNGEVRRLYPLYDEAATGNLQAVLNSDGEVIFRGLSQDPYGEDESTLAGAGVDKITVTATKESVNVDVRFTEQLDESTVAAGAAIAGREAILVDGFTLRSTFEVAAWNALPSIDIRITNALRAAAWTSSSPILPPPDWALETKPVFTSPDVPFEYRESTASLSAWLASIGEDETRTTTLYEVENLATLSGSQTTRSERLLALSTFQALPFEEPATGLIYVRERWLDPRTGTFISPDRAGYLDSSNLYAFTAGDPINGRDPTGDCVFGWGGTCAEWAAAGKKKLEQAKRYVDQHTDAGVLGVVVNATVGTVLDTFDVIALDSLRAGDATGTAIGSGSDAGEIALSVVQDVGRATAIAGGAGGAVKAGARGVSAVARAAHTARTAYRTSAFSSEVGTVAAGLQNVSAAQVGARARVLANIDASRAARRTSHFSKYSRGSTAFEFYAATGWSNPRIFQHMQGIDFTTDVRVVALERGHILEQWVVQGRPTGNYFSEPLSIPTRLGINPAGRVLEVFQTSRTVKALRSKAASVIDTWTPGGPFQTEGGGLQYFIDDLLGLRPR